MAAVGGQRHPGERCGGVRAPPRRGQPGQRRARTGAAGVVGGRRRRGRRGAAISPRSLDPADRRGGGVDLPVDAVGVWRRAAARPPSRSGRRWAARRVVPVLASRNAPVPKVHLAVPGRQAALGEQRGLLVDDQPADRRRRRRRRRWCRRRRRWRRSSGSRSPVEPEQVQQLGRPRRRCRGRVSSDRLAVAASVTNAPVSRCRSQVSVVVTTPSVVTLRAQPRHLRRGEVRVEDQPGALRDPLLCVGLAAAQRFGAPVLPHDGRARAAPGVRVPRQHGFALVGERDRRRRVRPPRRRRAGPASSTDVSSCARVLLDAAAGQVGGPHRLPRRSPRTAPSSATTTALVPEVP